MEGSKEFEIDGILTVPEEKKLDEVFDEFIEWAESKGYTFGGTIRDQMLEEE